MFNLVIIGCGPAGVAAGIYAARKKIKTLIIAEEFHGQSIAAGEIQNWVGVKSISGYDLAKALEEHLMVYEDALEIIKDDRVDKVEKSLSGFKIHTKNGKEFETKTVLVVSGGGHKRLGVPGETELDGKGVSFCSICDAPVFKDKVVAVIGGGNAGLEAVGDLLKYAKHIYLFEYMDTLKGDQITQEKIRKDSRVEVITSAQVLKITGKDFVTGLKYKNRKSGEVKEVKLNGVFVEVGMGPNSDFVKNLVKINKLGEIAVDPKTQASSVVGIWAAGDVSDGYYRQINIAVGDAIKAILNINDYLSKL